MQREFLTHAVSVRSRYLNLLESSLVGTLHSDPSIDPWSGPGYDPIKRATGVDWPSLAQTMIGTARLHSLRQMCETVLVDDVPGDMIETGVWRGGACILMKGVLEVYGDIARRVFVADSFRGLPQPNAAVYAADADDRHHSFDALRVSKDEVIKNFKNYDLLDDKVIFLEGWFKDTLASAPIDRLSILRLDGDMYESTIQALDALYHKVSYKGFVIIDDYKLGPCARAVHDFRGKHNITSPIIPIDGVGVWWRVQ